MKTVREIVIEAQIEAGWSPSTVRMAAERADRAKPGAEDILHREMPKAVEARIKEVIKQRLKDGDSYVREVHEIVMDECHRQWLEEN